MQELQIGRVYRHFKGDYYLVEGLAHDNVMDNILTLPDTGQTGWHT